MAVNKEERRELEAPELERPGTGHEEKDVNIWGVAKFAIGLACLCVVALTLVFGFFRYFQSREAAENPPQAGLDVDARRLPPEPRLQPAPIEDLKQMREAEDQILRSYGWVNRQREIVRLPIQRAMDALVQRGLPTRPQAGPQSVAAGVSVPTESGLGPEMMPPGGPLAPQLNLPPQAAQGE